MTIDEFIWPEERIEHIAKHGVTPDEVEEACFGKPFVLRARSEGENPVYYSFGLNRRGPLLVLRCDPLPGRQGLSGDGPGHDRQREASLSEMEREMKKATLPKTDSIKKLAEFWDSHDLTDFEDELEEVAEPVFGRGTAIKVAFESCEVEAVEQIAEANGISREELIRTWVVQKLNRRNKSRPNGR